MNVFDIDKVRADFPILDTKIHGKPLVYLDNAATTQKPLQVLSRVHDFYINSNSNIHRGVHYLSEQASTLYENARSSVKDFINAVSIKEVIFTSGTTESINLIAQSFGERYIKENDEIIVSEMEHHSNILPWQAMCRRRGAKIRMLPFEDKGRLITEKLPELITEKTKLIALCHVSNTLGVVNPTAEIIRLAHDSDIPVLLDAAQSVPHFPVDVQKLDCDFLVFSGHKMYAQTGIGVLYGKLKYLEQMPPVKSGGGMVKHVSFDKTTYEDLPLQFEAGTPNYAGAVSLAAAIKYIQNLGMKRIVAHESKVTAYALEQLQNMEGVTVYGGETKHGGVISFLLDGVHPYDAGVVLDTMGIAIRTGTHCAEPVMRHYSIPGTMRASFAVYNTIEEVNNLLYGIEKTRGLLL